MSLCDNLSYSPKCTQQWYFSNENYSTFSFTWFSDSFWTNVMLHRFSCVTSNPFSFYVVNRFSYSFRTIY